MEAEALCQVGSEEAGEEASGTPVLSLTGLQRLRYRGESQAPDTGISPFRILHPSVLVNLKQLRWTLSGPRPPVSPAGLNSTALAFRHQVAFPFQLLSDNPSALSLL